MARTKAELLEEANELKLEVTEKNTVAEITEAIEKANEVVPTEGNSESRVESAEKKIAAKAGKRSAKGQEEAEAKQEKIEKITVTKGTRDSRVT